MLWQRVFGSVLLLLSLGLSLQGWAQVNPEEPPPHRRFTVYSPVRQIDNLVYEAAPGEYRRLSVPNRSRSKVQGVYGDSITFYRMADPENPADSSRTPVAKVDLPPDQNFPLLIFLPRYQQQKPSYAVFPIEDDVDAVPEKSVRFMNLTPSPMVLLLGEEGKEQLQLRSLEIAGTVLDGDDPNLRVRVAIQEEGQVEKGLDRRIFTNPNARTLYFVTKVRPGSPALQISSLRDSAKRARNMQQPPGDAPTRTGRRQGPGPQSGS